MTTEMIETLTTEQQLKALAPLLAEADAKYKTISDKRKALEREALDALEVQHPDLYEQEQGWELARKLHQEKAAELLDAYRKETGNTGTILDGWYQITAPLKLQLDSEQRGDLLDWLLSEGGFLRSRWLTLDEKVIEDDLKKITDDEGSIKLSILWCVPAHLTPSYGTRIMWSKLPTAETPTETEAQS